MEHIFESTVNTGRFIDKYRSIRKFAWIPKLVWSRTVWLKFYGETQLYTTKNHWMAVDTFLLNKLDYLPCP